MTTNIKALAHRLAQINRQMVALDKAGKYREASRLMDELENLQRRYDRLIASVA